MNILIIDKETPQPYDSDYLDKNPCGASESYLHNLAVHLSKVHKVFFIQNKRTELQLKNNIRYLPENYNLRDLSVDNILLQRNLRYYPLVKDIFPKANIMCWLHDFYETKNFENMNNKHYGEDIQFICVSDWHKNNIKSNFIKDGIKLKNKIKVIYHLIDSPKEKDYLNNRFDKNKVCFFSSHFKGLENSYKLFKYLQNDIPELKFYMGSPSYSNVQLSIKDDSVIDLIGLPREQVLYHLSTSFCLLGINFTYPETFGCIFKEANMVGTPVLTTPIGATKEILSPEQIVIPEPYSADLKGEQEYINRFKKWYFKDERPIIKLEKEFRKENILGKWIKLMK